MGKFDDTIKKMQDITSSIKDQADTRAAKLDDNDREKLYQIAYKTIDVINEAAVKLKEASNKISDEKELDAFFDRVVKKCEEAKEYTLSKFKELEPIEENTREENLKKAYETLLSSKEKIKEYLNSPKTKIKINKAKLKALQVGQKGLDVLSNVLKK